MPAAGEPGPYEFVAAAVEDPEGEPVLTGIGRDISDRVECERELELFRQLIDQSNDSVLIIDPETGAFLDANETACRRRGYSREELLDLTVPRPPDQVRQPRGLAGVRGGAPIRGSTYVRRVPRTQGWIRLSGRNNDSYIELNDRHFQGRVQASASTRELPFRRGATEFGGLKTELIDAVSMRPES